MSMHASVYLNLDHISHKSSFLSFYTRSRVNLPTQKASWTSHPGCSASWKHMYGVDTAERNTWTAVSAPGNQPSQEMLRRQGADCPPQQIFWPLGNGKLLETNPVFNEHLLWLVLSFVFQDSAERKRKKRNEGAWSCWLLLTEALRVIIDLRYCT